MQNSLSWSLLSVVGRKDFRKCMEIKFLCSDGAKRTSHIVMPALEKITQKNFLAYKAVRLWALQDAPGAFGSTYERESQFTDSEWLQRAANLSSHRAVGYLSTDKGLLCGIAGAFQDEHDPLQATLVSMWVAPAYRRSGNGRALVSAILAWARARSMGMLRLTVTANNSAAIAFYERNGFSFTGKTEPYPNDPSLVEREMSQSLAPAPILATQQTLAS
jgi:ribosomal protein S18 acetylase RimI-like enzyme